MLALIYRRRRRSGGNHSPNQPTISAGTPTSSGVTLTGSVFSDPDGGDTHAASQWQVTTAADPTTPVIFTGDDAVNKTSYAASGLSASTAYLAVVRYKDNHGACSQWSNATPFTTAAGATVNRTDTYDRIDNAASLGTPSDGGSAPTVRGGTLGISGNQAYASAVNTSGAGAALNAWWSTASATYACSANGSLTVTQNARGGGVQGIMFRYVDNSNYWLYLNFANSLYLVRVEGGVATRDVDGTSSVQQPLADGVKLKVTLTAGGFSCSTILSGVEQVEFTDSVVPAGKASLHSGSVQHGILFADVSTTRQNDFTWVGA